MKVHHINCGTMNPRGARLLAPELATVPCNCLLVEDGGALVLVETGLGTADMADPSRLGHSNLMLHARRDPEQPAVRQVAGLGFEPGDVTAIVCTHLDRDHAGGLPDFPETEVHVLQAERDAAIRPRGAKEKDRYRPAHFAHSPRFVTHEPASAEPWFGFDCVRGGEGLPDSVVLVPLPGHTRGHCGVAIDTGDGWLLHCGDAFYGTPELTYERPPLELRVFRRVAHIDHAAAMRTLEKLKALRDEHASEVTMIASHQAEVPRGAAGAHVEVLTGIDIDAPREQVWRVLTDLDSYGDWNPVIRKAEGRLQAGSRIKVRFEPEPPSSREFRPRLLVVDEGRQLRWLGNPGVRGVLESQHYFILRDREGGTRLEHGMVFYGLVVPLAGGRLAAATRGPFERMNAALKERAELAMNNDI